MIGLSCLGHNQFECAKWYEKDKEQYKFIRVEAVSDNERRWNTVLQNMLNASGSELVRTTYCYPYENGQHLFYRDAWWLIVAVKQIYLDVNPQAMSLIKPKYNSQYVMEIIRDDNYASE